MNSQNTHYPSNPVIKTEKFPKQQKPGGRAKKRMYRKELLEDGTIRYYDDWDRLHRDDGPAIIGTEGEESWYKHGQLHREDGPALILSGGFLVYYKDGEELNEEERKQTILKSKLTKLLG